MERAEAHEGAAGAAQLHRLRDQVDDAGISGGSDARNLSTVRAVRIARSGDAVPIPSAAASQGVAYAKLPVDSLVDALSGLSGAGG